MNFESDLNKNQLEAVETTSQFVRVIAGAGSGKTRVLTYRIAFLLGQLHVQPYKVLAITFTNKVAAEMRNRVIKLLPDVEKDLTIKTFHSFAAYFLRQEITNIGFPSSFTILDEEDTTKMIKDIGASLGYKRTDSIIKKAMGYIGGKKLKEKYPDDIKIVNEAFEGEKECLNIYTLYEEAKNKMYALDFDDLLLKANYILLHYADVRSKWQRRIDHILIDEFQDTNDVEYKLVKLLVKPETSLYVVGDPDQTIYTWRGANQDIILNLDKDFPGIQSVVLDRNYRSTQKILDSANKLIAHNKFRVPKNLYTENNAGSPVYVRTSPSLIAEAEYVSREIKRLKDVENRPYNDIVILYRSNYITVEFEQALTAHQIPYRIYGGVKFYQRREIKDVLSYFRLISNSFDDVSFERIVNVPKRGIGETSVNALKREALKEGMSMYDYVKVVNPDQSDIPAKSINALKSMTKIIDITRDDINKNEEVFSKTLDDMLHSFGYYDSLIKDDDGEDRLENVKALFQDLRHYMKNHPGSTFDEYLQNIALISAQDEMIDGDYVTLMTVHTAKGLEYPVVFVVRFNDGVFPHIRSITEGYKGLEEERRLAYVAMTRAKEKLYLSCANGFSYVTSSNLAPSQFYLESGNILANETPSYNPYVNTKKPPMEFHFSDGKNAGFEKDAPSRQDFSQVTNDVDSWAIGDIVIHKKLGKGVVIELEGDDIIKVQFDEHGIKSILGSHPAVSKGSIKA